MTKCVHCASGRYTHEAHDQIDCIDCTTLDVRRGYWTNNLAGQSKCVPKPLDCVAAGWGSWSTCTKSCGKGYQTRTRKPERQPPLPFKCALGAQACTQAWGGGAACSTLELSQIEECNDHDCPVDCEVSSWGHWSTCDKTCDTGSTKRIREVTTKAAFGGKACPTEMEQTKSCNHHKCGWEYMPACHNKHVRCHVRQIEYNGHSRVKRPELPVCGHSSLEETSTCLNNVGCVTNNWDSTKWTHNCHKNGATFPSHKWAAGAKFSTIVVTHDRKNMAALGNFHCHRDATHANGCSCACDKHPTCCTRKNKVLTNDVLAGNRFDSITDLQTCCNMCNNHPLCTAFEFSGTTCSLAQGVPVYAENVDPLAITTFAGTPAPASGACPADSTAVDTTCGFDGQPTCTDAVRACKYGFAPVGATCRPCGKDAQPRCLADKNERPCAAGFGSAPAGKCATCGSQDQVVCDGADEEPCHEGFARSHTAALAGTCTACGGHNQPHCTTPGSECGEGFVIQGHKCLACGAAGQPLCGASGALCGAGAVSNADGSSCVTCGGDQQLPCLAPAAACNSGFGLAHGKCSACGQAEQPRCTSHERTCRPGFGTKSTDALCHRCGREGEVSCLAPEPACKAGFALSADDTCASAVY